MPSEASLRKKLKKKTKHVLSTSRNSMRTKKDEISFEKNGVCDRGNESEGKLKKRVKFKGMQSGEEVEERRKLRTLEYSGKKKRVYAKEGRDKNGKLENGVATFKKKKTLFKKGEKQVKDEPVGGNSSNRTMWVPGKSRNAGLKVKHSLHMGKERKENVVLATAKQKAKAKEEGKFGFVGADDQGSGLVKRSREKKSELRKGRSQEVVSPLSSTKKKARDKARLDDDDAEMLDERPKKKKRVIKIDPHDISNKRLDDGVGVNGSKEEKEKEKESDKEHKMSKNAQFRAIQPSPSILSFVEKNLLGRRRMIDLRRAGYNIDLSAPLDNIPFSSSSEREKIEENIFRNKLEFFAAAKVSSSFPPPNLPEIAFAGRSNVGKSSLLNALTIQWGVVRTSDKPGLTQTINFFKLGTKLCLVDLPGYGFAYAKEEVKESWEELVLVFPCFKVMCKV
ncbi:GTP-binding protein EngB [Spatholobus suberectus]|nr:GTP-binding protein EngB [Spatholobus suberectus]